MAQAASFSTLPRLAAVPVSQEARLAYVLRHFAMVYEGLPDELPIGYDAARGGVVITDYSSGFFTKTAPYPAAPNWRDWTGQQVPFFFDQHPEKPLLETTPGAARINADIISAAFYLLSGWQEYFSAERDRHGRFPYAASVQKQYGFVALPVVNYYFDVLKTALEHVTGQPLCGRRWGTVRASFCTFISHDIDLLYSSWKAPAKAALKLGKLLQFGRLYWQHLTRPDAWDNLETIAAAVAQYGARSTFFILPEHHPGIDGTTQADYPITPKLLQRLDALEAHGHPWELHGSLGTATEPEALANNCNRIGHHGEGIRFHYLRWEPRLTPRVVEGIFKFDSTLGFAEHFGFRHSYCHPFYPFDLESGRAFSFLEIPLNVMDTTLHHPNYLQLSAPQILPALQPLFAEIEKFGGVLSILWHNDHFDPANDTTGPAQFHEIMRDLQQRGTTFLTGRQITNQFSDWRPV
jgi:peptidoglycan/xylan/chitin deacetylase (PgdA/CDA1 family)